MHHTTNGVYTQYCTSVENKQDLHKRDERAQDKHRAILFLKADNTALQAMRVTSKYIYFCVIFASFNLTSHNL